MLVGHRSSQSRSVVLDLLQHVFRHITAPTHQKPKQSTRQLSEKRVQRAKALVLDDDLERFPTAAGCRLADVFIVVLHRAESVREVFRVRPQNLHLSAEFRTRTVQHRGRAALAARLRELRDVHATVIRHQTDIGLGIDAPEHVVDTVQAVEERQRRHVDAPFPPTHGVL